MDASSVLVGTLCHYDVVPRDAEQIDIPAMLSIASYIGLGGHVPPYPQG